MEVIYLSSTIPDINWLTHYYEEVFPAGRLNMRMQLYAAEQLLEINPHIGRLYEHVDGVRELQISKTPFSLLYRVTNTHIEIMRVWDQRRDRTALSL